MGFNKFSYPVKQDGPFSVGEMKAFYFHNNKGMKNDNNNQGR